ncbi:MAG: AI-2E family transporter [Epsilonproteobacteria bacterium]|nr:AI-2E family transporter [Campylobacterota bacterium]NPA63407.1 AI-2E family transporter [Campylobacterota bacterium]
MSLYAFAAVLVSIIALKFLAPILIYLILSLFFTILLAPIFRFFDQRGLPAILAYFLTLFGFIAIVGAVIVIVESSSKEFSANLPLYQTKFKELLIHLQAYLNRYNLDPSVLNEIDVLGILKKFIANFGSVLKGFLIVVIGVSFLLFESKDFGKKIAAFSKNPHYFEAFFASVQKYFLIKTFTSFLTGLFVGLMLYAYGVPYAFLFGFLAFVLNYIPVIGSIIAAIPGIALALVTYGIETALWVALWYLAINISISNVLEPKIMGDGLDISAAVVFFSLVFWGWIFGVVGTFFAVPLTMTLKLALQSSPKTRHWAMLLSRYKESR